CGGTGASRLVMRSLVTVTRCAGATSGSDDAGVLFSPQPPSSSAVASRQEAVTRCNANPDMCALRNGEERTADARVRLCQNSYCADVADGPGGNCIVASEAKLIDSC